MANKDGGGSATWAGLRIDAFGVVNSIDIVNVAPKTKDRIGATIAPLSVLVDSLTGNVDVEFQVATDTAFASVVRSQTLTNLANGIATYAPTALSTGTTYYWRARAAPTGTSGWGPWTGDPTAVAGAPFTLTGKTVTASSEFDTSTYAKANAFDGNTATHWATVGEGFPAAIGIDYGSDITVGAYTVTPRQDASWSTQTPTAWKLQGATAAAPTTWIDLDTRTGVAWDSNAAQVFALAAPATYRHFRLGAITAVLQIGGTRYAAISELGLSGSVTTVIAPWSFLIDVNVSRGSGYVTENLGIDPTLVKGTNYEYVSENAGLLLLMYAGDREYVSFNVGVERILKSDAREYAYEGDVSTNRPTPHLWFLWLPYGFAGNEVWAYGHGFGNPQSEYTGLIKVDPGPDYSTLDLTLGVNEWYLKEIEAHAYDAERTIHPGAFGTPPNVTMECEIIRWVVPSGIMPPIEPVIHKIYVQHTGGPSNKVDWLMYPTIPVAAANIQRGPNVASRMRLTATHPGEGIEQLYFFTQVPLYVITAGRAERPAGLTAGATAVGELGTWSTEDALADALAVDLGATYRWLPDESKLTPRPDLGTGVVVWDPSVGSGSGWKLRPDSSPYVDPAYTIPSRLGDLEVPAMVFPGDAFAELTAAISSGPTFTFAMVAVVHPAPDGRGTVLSTFQPTPNPGDHDWELYYEGDQMKLAIGGLFSRRPRSSTSGRPVIVLGSVADRVTQLLVVDEKPTTNKSIRTSMADTGNKAYLARSWRVDTESIDFANMDVLEVAWWNTGLSMAQMWAAATKLDGIYGVTR